MEEFGERTAQAGGGRDMVRTHFIETLRRAVARTQNPRSEGVGAEAWSPDRSAEDAELALDLLGLLLEHAPLGILLLDPRGRVTALNRQARQILAVTEDEVQQRPLAELFPSTLRGRVEEVVSRVNEHPDSAPISEVFSRVGRDGRTRSLEIRVAPAGPDADLGALLLIQEVTEREWSKNLYEGHARSLELLAAGASLHDILAAIVQTAERARPEMIFSVLLVDEEGKRLLHGAAPSLPDFYNEAVDGLEIGPGVGCCGAAAYRGERVVVADVMTHPNWESYRSLAEQAGIRACWSQPIFSSGGRLLGTFAMYYREVREPDAKDLEVIERTAHMCGVAIERARGEAALRRARIELETRVEERTEELAKANEALVEKSTLLETLIDILPVRIFAKDAQSRFILNNRMHLDLLGVESRDQARGKTTFEFFPDERGALAMADDERVLRSGQPLINRERFDSDPGGSDRWVLTTKVPLRGAKGEILGLAGMSHDITDRKIKEAELARLTEQLRARNRQMETDLKMAREIQQACLPQSYPTFPSDVSPTESALRFYHRYQPTTTLAGDFFDVLAVSDDEAGVLICDVMGHGVRASLVTALLRGLVEQMMGIADDPAAFLKEINRGLISILRAAGSPMFVTAFYVVADVSTGHLRYANAGHPSPLLLRRDAGVVEPLRPDVHQPEPGLGFLEAFDYSTWESNLDVHDLVVLFTDGLCEYNNSGDRFGSEELLEAVRRRIHLAPDELIDDVFEEIHRFSGEKEFTDDVCLVAMEVTRRPE